MFKNQNLEAIMRLEGQLSAIDLLISEAEFRFDFVTVNYYEKVREELSRELSTRSQDHKESLAHDYELVYSC